MTFAALKTAIYNWVTSYSGLPAGQVIFEEQGSPRPPRPYATIAVSWPGVKLGATDDQRTSGSVFSVEGMREVTVSLNIQGADAHETLSSLRDTLELPSVMENFSAQDLAVVNASDVRNLSELEETAFMLRAQLDLTVRYTSKVIDTGISTIEHVQAGSNVDGVAGSLTVN